MWEKARCFSERDFVKWSLSEQSTGVVASLTTKMKKTWVQVSAFLVMERAFNAEQSFVKVQTVCLKVATKLSV